MISVDKGARMPELLRAAVGSTRYRLKMPHDRSTFSSSSGMCSWQGIPMPVRAQDALTVATTLETLYSAETSEVYSLGEGELSVGEYTATGPDDNGRKIELGRISFATWTSGEYALWTEGEFQSAEWLIEFFEHIAPEVADGVARLGPNSQLVIDDEGQELLLTVAGLGLLELSPRGRRRPRATGGTKGRAGRLFSDNKDADQPAIVLETSSAICRLSFIEGDVDEVLQEFASFEAVEVV
jgi:hypothetical protein